MSQSYLFDVEKMLGKEGAEEYLKELNYDPIEGLKKQVKGMFSFLQDNDIVEILKKYNNSMEDAFEELMDKNSQLEEEKKRERQLQEQKIREQQNERYIETFVRNFQMFDKKEIEEAFKNNNNDPQLTSKQLYQMMKEREQKNEEAKKMKREMEIQNLCAGFSIKFEELSKEEIMEVIVKKEMNVDVIAVELGKMQKQKIFDDLFIQFRGEFSCEEIRKALDELNWSKNDARNKLQGVLKEKELEAQRIKEQEQKKQLELKKQRDEQLEKELREQEEVKRQREMLRKQQEEENKRKLEIQKEIETRKLKERELQREMELEMELERQKLREMELQRQIELQRVRELELQEEIERQRQRDIVMQRELEEQREREIVMQKEIALKRIKEMELQVEIQVPKLEYDEKQMEELKKESVFKVVDVKLIVQAKEEEQEIEVKKNIELMIIENSDPEIIPIVDNLNTENSDSSSEENSITVTVEETKISAQIVLKGQTNYSWVGFFNKNDDSANYKNYNYLCKLSDSTFVVEKPLLNGIYHFRVFSGKYSCVKTSEDIVINKEDKVTMVRDEKNDKVINVTWQLGSVDPYAVSAYVTVHKKEEERPNYYRRWNWIKTFNGTHTFKTPIHTGEYEARVYFSGKLQFKSDLLIIEGI